MLKTLLRKQFLEFRRIFFYSRKKGVYTVSKGTVTARIILFALVYISLFGGFLGISFGVGENLIKENLAWIFFMIMGMLAFLAGVFVNAFSAAGTLFQAKDNELLLSLPIPPSKILIARMGSIYILGLIYESMVLFPAILFYFIKGRASFLSVVFCILSFFLLGLLILTFSCLLGWVVALINRNLKNKSFLSVIVSVIVIGLFIWFRVSANSLFRGLMQHAKDIGKAVEGWGYPLYAIGLGMSGNVLGFLVFALISIALFALICWILSRSFHRIVAEKSNAVRKTFSLQQVETRSIHVALRRKEMKRFTSSSAYMLNCGMGLLFLVIGGALLLFKMGDIREMIGTVSTQTPFVARLLPVLGAFAVCLLVPLCDIAACSISLEGKNIWLLQALPVDPYAVFLAKLYVHLVITAVPTLFCTVTMILVLRPSVFAAVCMLLAVAAYLFFSAVSMLAIDLKRPMMDWTSEVQPIKQNLNILFSWLGGLLVALILAGLYLVVSLFAGPEIYLLLCAALLTVLALLLLKWLRTKGRELFANL